MTWKTIGFEKIKIFFEKSLKKGLLSHAYIFSGGSMMGKKTFALELAGFAIGVEAGMNTNLLFIDAAGSESGQSIAIDEIRKIKSFLSLTSYLGPYKFVIIDDAHLMTAEAQNALLKILEEPSQSSILILITANPDSLLSTINSRCQEIQFPVHSRKIIDEFLKNSGLPKTKAKFLAEFANGKIGLIYRIAEERSFDEVEYSVKELMHLVNLNIHERLDEAQKLADDKNKTGLPKLVLYWILYMRMRLNEPRAHKILGNLLILYNTVNQPQFNQRLALENFLVQL